MTTASSSDIHAGPTHLEGVTRLAFARDGKTIFTGGTDSIVRIHNPLDLNAEPSFYDEHRSEITCMTCSSSHFLTGSEDGKVRSFLYPENKFDTFVTSAGAVGIRWLAVDYSRKKGEERVAVCSDELIVKIVNIRDTSQTSLITCSKPVRSASWHPTNGSLTLVSSDGKILIYELLLSGATCTKVMENMFSPITSSAADADSAILGGEVCWHPSGEYFVFGSRGHEIAIIDRDSWSKIGTFSSEGHDSEIGLLAWSPNGKYLVSSGKDEQIIVWGTDDRKVLKRYKNSNGIVTGLAFSPTDNLIAYTTLDGSFFTWSDPIPEDHPHPAKAVYKERSTTRAAGGLGVGMFDDVADVEMRDDDAEEGEGDDVDDLGDDWIIDDDEGLGKEREDSPGFRGGAKEVVSITKAQPAFQPGSTPMKGKKRYLAFNMIGVIDVTDQDSHHVVNIEFHDKSARRGTHFQDHTKYSMAALGERGIVYAAAQEGQPSPIHYKAYDAWASQSDWQYNLPDGEVALLVAAGGKAPSSDFEEDVGMGSVIVATSRGYIRFFSDSGIQRYLWRMGEEMISMVAGKDMVFLVHREGGTSLDGCQNLRYTLIDLETFDLVQEGRLPLPKRTTLSWIGFTEYGAPAMYDSTGLLSILDRHRRPGQARWSPLLDSNTLARKVGKDETYWPVGVTASQFMCIILKGSDREPYFPRPLVLDLDMNLPLLNMDQTQGQLEEKIVRGNMQLGVLKDAAPGNTDSSFTIRQKEVDLDKELLQLVQAACKADKLQRALDLVRLMHNTATMDAASKVAAFYHLPGLQEKIGLVREAIEDKRREAEDQERRSSRRSIGSSHPVLIPSSNASSSRNPTEFAPRSNFSRRTGAAQPAPSSAYSNTSREESFVAETPEVELVPEDDSMRLSSSPNPKRKRDDSEFAGESGRLAKAPFPMDTSDRSMGPPKAPASKNPFARKPAPPSSNPFAKPSKAAAALNKSTSFFERVDNIEAGEKSKSKGGKGKDLKEKGKQTSLLAFAAPDGAAKKASKLKSAAPTKATTPVRSEPESRRPAEVMEDESEMEETQVNAEEDVQQSAEDTEQDAEENDAQVESPMAIEWEASDDEAGAEQEEEAADEAEETAEDEDVEMDEDTPAPSKLEKYRMASQATA